MSRAAVPPALSEDISTVLHQLSRNLGMTLLLVEHRLPFIQHIADRFCLMAVAEMSLRGR